jgi:hypothetical protein
MPQDLSNLPTLSSLEAAEQPEVNAQPQEALETLPSLEEIEAPGFNVNTTGIIKDNELKEIASRYKVPVQFLRKMTDIYWGVREQEPDESPEKAQSMLSSPAFWQARKWNAFGLADVTSSRILSGAWKKFIMDEKQQRAVAEVYKMVEDRKSTLLNVFETGVGLAAAVATPAPVLKAIGSAAKLGAAGRIGAYTAAGAVSGGMHGYLGSTPEDELTSTIKGASLGAVLGGGLGAAFEGASLFGKKISERVAAREGPKVIERAGEMRQQFDVPETQMEEVAQKIIQRPELLTTARTELLEMLEDASFAKALLPKSTYEEFGKKAVKLLPKEMRQSLKRGVEVKDEFLTTLGEDTAQVAAKWRNAELHALLVEQELKKTAGFHGFVGQRGDKTLQLTKWLNENRIARTGASQLAETFRGVRDNYYRKQIVREMDTAGRAPSIMGRLADRVIDAQFALSGIDRRYNLMTEVDLNTVGKALDDASVINHENKLMLEHLVDRTYKLGIDNEDVATFLNSEAGRKEITKKYAGNQEILDFLGKTDPKSEDIIGWRDYFDKIREKMVGKYKANIPYHKDYLPNSIVDYPELISRMDARWNELRNVYEDVPTFFGKLKKQKDLDEGSQAFVDYVRALELTTDVKNIVNKSQLKQAQVLLEQPNEIRPIINLIARAEKGREGQIPDFILNKDVVKLASRWVEGVVRSSMLRAPATRLRLAADVLKEAGDIASAQRLTNLVQDLMTGTDKASRTFSNLADRYKISLARAAESMEDGMAKRGVEIMGGMPDVLSFLGRQMYNNLLGWRVKPVLRNITQPFGTTATEIGNNIGGKGYGAAAVLSAYLDVWRLTRGEGIQAFLEKRHLIPKGYVSEATSIKLPEEVKFGKSGGITKFFKQVSNINDAGLKLLTMTDNVNRAVTYFAAQRVAKDFFAGKGPAKEFANKIGEGWKVKMRLLQKEGKLDEEALTDIFASHLIDRTQFRYNRALAGEMTRALGPLLMAFSKWPTAVAGDIVDKVRQYGYVGGAKVNALKWLAPLAALDAIDKAIEFNYQEASPQERGLMYKEGWSALAPVSAVSPTSIKQLAQSPFVQVVGNIVEAAANGMNMEEGDGEALKKMMDKAYSTYMPGGGAINLFRKEIPQVIFNEEPSEMPWRE